MRTRHGRWLSGVILALLMLLAGCAGGQSASVSPTAPPIPTPTTPPTATAIPTVLYKADWSSGAGAWKLPPHWRISGGKLTNDGLGSAPLPVPYTITAPNYAIELRAQAIAVPGTGGCGTYFGIGAQDATGKQLYLGDATCIFRDPPFHSDSDLVTTGDYPSGAIARENVMNTNPKTYTITVHGSNVVYSPGATAIGGLTAPYPLAPAHPFIADAGVQVVITSFTIWRI
ncbi:MAG: hypothetical protein OJF49_002395 [Ktedonobacterales bacterium]|jgi:hypothetical protein|nr:MAG: hypothetical protein OJF49_002395 [Ktedonobacterales bacterium]